MSTTEQEVINYIFKHGPRVTAALQARDEGDWDGPLDEDHAYETARDQGEI